MPTNLELRKQIKKLVSDLNKVAADSTAYSAIVDASGLGGVGGEPARALETYYNAIEVDAGYSRTALSEQRPNNAIDLYLGKEDPNNPNAAAGVAIELPVVAGAASMLFSINLSPSTFANQTAAYVVADPANPENFLATQTLSPLGGNTASSVNTTGLDKVLVVVYCFASFGAATNNEGARLSIDSLSLSEFQPE